MTQTNQSGPWLIGGAGRSGKTTLANTLATASNSIAGFPLEGVFHVYLQRRFPFFRHQRRRLLHEYLTRPRYIDAQRSQVERPIDYFAGDVNALANELPNDIDSPIPLFAWLLDRYAIAHGRQTWAVFDLLPELRYASYRKLIPGVRLAVMRRAPEEAVAEAMYWRSYPDPPPDRSRRFWSMLFQWRLSQVVTQSLAARFGDDIAEFSFNALIDGDEAEQTRLGAAFDMERNAISDAFAFTPPFRYRSGDGFCGPDSMWRNLLTDDELANIAAAASGNMWRRDLRALLAIAPAFPMLARNLGDFTMYPGTFTVRRVNAFRQLAADTAAGVRLTLGVQA